MDFQENILGLIGNTPLVKLNRLAQGVKDVVVLDPESAEVTHHEPRGEMHYKSPAQLALACGCECTV